MQKLINKNVKVLQLSLPFSNSDKINLQPEYSIPEKTDMLVVMCFFNPSKSIRLVQNFLYVKELLTRTKIPLVIVELAYNDDSFITQHNENTIHVRSNSIMFHKENLINIGINKCKLQYNKYCMLDSDIIFDDLNWYDNISNELDNYDIIQPFEKAFWMDIDMTNIIQSKYSVAYNNKKKLEKLEHPGFVWAFTKKWYKKIGLPEFCISGGGDQIIANVAFKTWGKKPNYINSENFDKYIKKAEINFTSSYMKGNVYHLFHGNLNNRQYSSRHERIKNEGYSDDCLQINRDGVYEWIPSVLDKMNKLFLTYFMDRKDDSIV
jgi:hypothetical protein